jgi:uncharacterized membrane protein
MKIDVGTSPSAQASIETVAKIEHQALDDRNWKDKLGDAIAGFVGTMAFVLCHALGLLLWIVINSGAFPLKPFDPYPYTLLTMIVSLEGVIIATFVLMKQNRMSRRSDQRDHLNLQIDLLAEKEITKMLQLQRLICERLGIEEACRDEEVREFSQHTAVEAIARDLETKIPEE